MADIAPHSRRRGAVAARRGDRRHPDARASIGRVRGGPAQPRRTRRLPKLLRRLARCGLGGRYRRFCAGLARPRGARRSAAGVGGAPEGPASSLDVLPSRRSRAAAVALPCRERWVLEYVTRRFEQHFTLVVRSTRRSPEAVTSLPAAPRRPRLPSAADVIGRTSRSQSRRQRANRGKRRCAQHESCSACTRKCRRRSSKA